VARLAEEYLAILARVTLDPHVCLQEIRADLSPDFPQERGPKDDSLSIGAALS
jgi:hypothetical protein